MQVIRHIILLLLCWTSVGSFAQTEQEMRKQADQLFNSGKYVDATPLYTRLLALQPRDYGYNFRYGACLLFNSSKKQEALKYLNFAIQDPSTKPDIFYFLGRALHLNYQFNEAIENYTAYRKEGKNTVFLKEAERFIEMCKNGKQLLSNITDVIVLDKKEIASDKFFRLYDLKDIGGNILVTLDFQTKLDKKNNHQPVIHFPNQPKAIFYASYGEVGTTGKDIYVRTKQNDGSWSDPQAVKGGVNTPFDEDYPYMHPDGEHLYFASKGHNSMGGFDIFRCSYDQITNVFGPAENLDFAISSPDDDLFFVLDSLNRDAFFASARQSEAGKLTVYKVKVDRVPLQLAVLKGDFISKVDATEQTARIDVINTQTGKKVGSYQTNKESNYMITLPKAGEYEFVVRIGDRSQEFRSKVLIPQLNEFRPLKQQLVHTTENGIEIVRVVNLFNENVENPEDVLAEVIRVRSTLDVNAQDFDLASLEATQESRNALAELGLSKMNDNEVVDVLTLQIEKTEKQVSFNADLQQSVFKAILETAAAIKEKEEFIKKQVQAATTASSDIEKYKELSLARQAINEQDELRSGVNLLTHLADSIDAVIKNSTSIQQQTALIELKSAVEGDLAKGQSSDAWKNLASKSDVLRTAMNDNSGNIIENNTQRQVILEQQLTEERNKRSSLESDKQKVETEIYQLSQTLNAAKKKEQPTIQSTIDKKKEEVQLIEEEIAAIQPKATKLTNEINQLKNDLAIIQLAMDRKSTENVSRKQANQEFASTQSTNSSTLHAYVSQQLFELEKANPELKNLTPQQPIDQNEPIAKKDLEPEDNTNEIVEENEITEERIGQSYASEAKAIEENNALTSAEKQRKLNDLDEQLIGQVETELSKVEEELVNQSTNKQLLTQKQALVELKASAKKRIESRTVQEPEIEVEEPIQQEVEVAVSSTQLLIDSHASDVQKVSSNTSLTEDERLNALDLTDEVLKSALNERMKAIQQQLVEGPNNAALNKERVQIDEQIVVLEAAASERAQLREMKTNKSNELIVQQEEKSTDKTSNEAQENIEKEPIKEDNKQPEVELTTAQLLQTVYPDYTSKKNELLTSRMEERKKQEQLLSVEKELLSKLETKLTTLQKEATTSNPQTQEITLTEQAIEEQKANVAEANRAIVEMERREQDAFVTALRSNENERISTALSGELGNEKVELEDQLQVLETYQSKLQAEEERLVTANQSRQVAWVNEELNRVDAVIKKVRITLGELERIDQENQELETNETKEVVQSVSREEQIRQDLTSSAVSKKERKELVNELNVIEEKKAVQEIEQLEAKQSKTESIVNQLQSDLKTVSAVNATTKRNQELSSLKTNSIEEEIAVLEEKLAKSRRPQEKKEILQSITEKQDELTAELSATYLQNKLLEIESKEELGTLESLTELTARKRHYTIQIGELTKLLTYTENELTTAKGKEKTALIESKSKLNNQLKLTNAALQATEERIAELDRPIQPAMDLEATSQAISVEEEVALAQLTEYIEIEKKGTRLLELEKEQKRLSELRDQSKAELKAAIVNTSTDESLVQSKVEEVKNTTQQLKRVEEELASARAEFQRNLPTDQVKARMMQNMVQRGIQPIDQSQLAQAIVPLPEMGLEITEKQVERSIPLGVKNPSGLVYRVQVGAFAKPIPGELFKEFNPVSGEAIPNSNIMRYMAGFFNNSQRALNARDEIRKLGYADAFAVAYCDGKRISIAEARRLEQSGQCVPKGTNQLLLEVAMNTMEKMQLDDTTKRPRVNPLDYNKAKGAATASAIEASTGLFFTVQLGVFNRPISATTVYQLEPLMTFRLPNGQIRYSVGMFNSIEEARPMQAKAKAKGIADAFITAYYKGQRITLQEAQQLVETQGASVLENNTKKANTSPENKGGTSATTVGALMPNRTVQDEPLNVEPKVELQLVSKLSYSAYPKEELNRYNSKGFFYYDETDQKIKSSVATSAEQLPPVYYFRNELDTLKLRGQLDSLHYFNLLVEKIEVSGDFAEWFVRYPGRKEIREVETGIEIRIFDKTEKQREDIQSTLERLGLTTTEEWLVPVRTEE